ncbi:MAG: hypothetical protein IPK59_22210 [Rhodospirillaceae bacterium]|nr:hypothetical protein [Rhodospirillaceae bacterium]
MLPSRGIGRRRMLLLAAGACCIPLSAGAQSGGNLPVRSVKRLTRNGAGRQDGTDWPNAWPVARLSKGLATAAPGDVFLIGASQDDRTAIAIDHGQIAIKTSGSQGHPITVSALEGAGVGESADAAPPSFESSVPWTIERVARRKGSPCYLALTNGASYLRLTGFQVEGTSADGLMKFRARKTGSNSFQDVQISDIDARNVGRLIETDRNAFVSDMQVEDCRARAIMRGFARFHNLSNAVFRRLDLDAEGIDGGGKNVCQLISIGSGANILFEDVILKNAVNARWLEDGSQGYVQGDGIVCERKTSDITLRKCHGSGMGDAAFDLKSTRVLIEDSGSDSCKFGARVWSEGDNMIRRSHFRNPVTRGSTKGACIQASGTLVIHDTILAAGGDTSAIMLHRLKTGTAPVVHMYGGAINIDNQAALARSSDAGTLELHDVAVNGTLRSRRYDLNNNETR